MSMSRPPVECEWLTAPQAPLASAFYRSQGSKEKVRGDEQVAVARLDGQIVAALRISPRDGHWLLRAMRVSPELRQQGIATELLRFALAQRAEPLWCFALAALAPWYQLRGFEPVSAAPAAIEGPYRAYAQRQPLTLMCWQPAHVRL